MKKSKILICIYLIISVLYSCRPKNIEIDIEEPASKTVLNCILQAGQTNMAFISGSTGSLKADTLSKVKNAELQIFENYTLVNAYKQQENGEFILTGFLPKSGNTYTIKAIAGNNPQATAQTTIPFPVEISIDDSAKIKWIQSQGVKDRFVELKISIIDSSQTDDYYVIRARRRVISGESDSVSVDEVNKNPQHYLVMLLNSPSVDISAQDGIFSLPMRESIGSIYQGGYGDYMLLSDKLFNGKKQQFILNLNLTDYYNYFQHFDMLIDIEVTRVNYEYYKYICTYELHRQTLDDPFSEKVQVYNNVENGFGILAAGAMTSEMTYFKK